VYGYIFTALARPNAFAEPPPLVEFKGITKAP
jgi:hypothetical protein